LEQVVGINNVIECHGMLIYLYNYFVKKYIKCFWILGSFATASCTQCGHKVSAETIRPDVFDQRIPRCPICINSTGNIYLYYYTFIELK